MRKKCIVIGAGLAGLAAAHRAVQNRWEVDVLEASDRYGGRVFTQRHDRKGRTPLVYELGGEWIGTKHKQMLNLCAEFELELIDHRYSPSFWRPGKPLETFAAGKPPFPASLQNKFENFSKQMKKHQNDIGKNLALDRIDWWTKLKDMGFRQKDLEKRDLMDSTDFGESIRQTSAYVAAAEYVFSNQFDEMDMKIEGGNDRLSDALVSAINKKRRSVHLKQAVAKIEQANDEVRVTARTGSVFTGDACICAVPAPSLTKIRWNPPLPDEQREAAKELQYARIAKTAVLFPEKIWEKISPPNGKSGFSMFSNRVSDFCFESTFKQDGPEGVICSYAIGDKADDLASEKHKLLAEWISADVSHALGACLSKPAVFLAQKAWQREKAIGGAYAFYRLGQWFTVRPALARPHYRVLFAGEHLSEDWQGFMEGAVKTGQAAADAL